MTKLSATIASIKELDAHAMAAARTRQDQLTKPQGSLGRLEELSIQIAGITGNPMPHVNNKCIVTMAGDHGICAQGVSAYPSEVTPQMVFGFLAGKAGVNVLAAHAGARVTVVDMGVASDLPDHPLLIKRKVARGTADFSCQPAMTREQALQAVEAGIEIVELEYKKGLDIVGTGDMGIGNTTPSTAIAAVITKKPVVEIAGRGTGIDDKGLAHKIKVIENALMMHKPDAADGIDILCKVGGFEIAGLAGVIIGAAGRRLPVVIDGFISGAAALIAAVLAPQSKQYMIAAHCSADAGHSVMLDFLGLEPLLDLRMRLGEGTGAALGISLCDAACKALTQMVTFAEAGVSGKK